MKQKFYLTKLVLFFACLLSASVGANAACDPVTSPAGTTLSTTSVSVMWIPPMSGAMAYEYVLSPMPMTPSGSGISTMMTSETVTGLTPATTYYLYVRTDCGSGTYSAWVGPTTVVTASASSCIAPTPSAMAVSCDTGAGMWPAVSGAMGYECVVTTSATPPSGSGTPTTATMFMVPGLSPSTTYHVYVRTDCGMGSYSAWATTPFTTPACAPACLAPTGITKTPGATNVALSWTAAAGAMSYEYKVATSSTTPTTAGTALTATSVTVPGLTPGTPYYAFVRTKCGTSSYSPWSSAQSFSTSTTGIALSPAIGTGALIQVYPNPVADDLHLNVVGTITDLSAISVTAVDGRVIKTIAVKENSAQVNMGDLSRGIYFVKYTDGTQSQVIKVVKQ